MKQVFRSKVALLLGWVWMAFAAFNAVDLTVRYKGQSSMVAAAVLAVVTAVVFVTCLRPATILGEAGVRVRNPLRTVFLPWRRVEEVTVSHTITILSEGRVVRCWTPQVSGRERAAAMHRGGPPRPGGRYRTEPTRSAGERAALEALGGKTHADWVAEQITERAEAARRTGATPPESGEPGPVKVTWAPTALAALVAAILLVVVAIVV